MPYIDSTWSISGKSPKQTSTENGASNTEEPTDSILSFTATANHLNLPCQKNGQPKLQPEAVKKLLPSIEAFVAKDKYSQAVLFIKKFKDFKQGCPYYRQTVMMQIEKTMSLQSEDQACSIRIIKYLIADNNLYVVMQHCQQSIKGLLRS